jgi:hypothetical protein
LQLGKKIFIPVLQLCEQKRNRNGVQLHRQQAQSFNWNLRRFQRVRGWSFHVSHELFKSVSAVSGNSADPRFADVLNKAIA